MQNHALVIRLPFYLTLLTLALQMKSWNILFKLVNVQNHTLNNFIFKLMNTHFAQAASTNDLSHIEPEIYFFQQFRWLRIQLLHAL